MCSGPLLSKMMVFAIPVVITSVLQIMYNAADMIVVGRFASDTSLASVGSTAQLINLLVGFFNGMAVGASVVAARLYGAGDRQGVNDSVHTAVTLSVVCGVAIGIVGLLASDFMLELMGTPEDVIGGASEYLQTYFVGTPALIVYNFAAAILRAVGDTKRPMYFLIVSGLVNVVLNLLFVIGFKMDVAGVAWATTISQYLSAAMIILCMIRSDNCVRLDLRRLRIRKKWAKEIMRIGLPSGIQASMFNISNVLIQSGINSFGAAHIAGSSAASSIEGFISLATAALYQVNLSFVGQNMGAKKYDRIEKINRIGIFLSLVIWVVLGGAIFLLRYPLMSIYTDDPASIEAGAREAGHPDGGLLLRRHDELHGGHAARHGLRRRPHGQLDRGRVRVPRDLDVHLLRLEPHLVHALPQLSHLLDDYQHRPFRHLSDRQEARLQGSRLRGERFERRLL